MKTQEGKASYDHSLTRLRRLSMFLRDRHLQDIDKVLVGDIVRFLLTEEFTPVRKDPNDKQPPRRLSPVTVNDHLKLLISILNYAYEQGWVQAVPKIKKLKTDQKRLEYLEPEEVSAMLPHLAPHVREFLVFSIATGLRMRNVTHLTWDQVDMESKLLTIRSDQYKTGRSWTFPLTESAVRVLEKRRQESPTGRVFRYRGKPYDVVKSATLNRAARKAGVQKHIHPHLLRHTFACWHMLTGETTLYELKELGGWSKIDSVLIYAHLNVNHLRQVEFRTKTRKIFTEVLSENCQTLDDVSVC